MTMKMAFAGLAVALMTQQAWAHETWLEATDWQVAVGDTIKADIRNGVDMEGPSYPWFAPNVVRAEVYSPSDEEPFVGQPGDLPAFQVEATEAGLHVLLYESKPTRLTYDNFDLFREFTEEKGWPSVLEEHLASGYPQQNLSEAYDRHVKALIAVGDGSGTDTFRGMSHEIVAETNPYALAPDESMTVRVYHEDEPRADARVTVFQRNPEGEVDHLILQTDADGRASFPVQAGWDYLVDSVHVRRANRSEIGNFGAIWKSSWAALTFGFTDRD